MRFTGRIRFGDVQDADLDVVVEVGETHLRLVSGDESLGSWCLADVVANRVVSNEFEIDLDGKALTFLADDQVNFAYGAVQNMAEGWARYHAMNVVRRKRAVASARRHNEPDRLENVRRALVSARQELEQPVVDTPLGVLVPEEESEREIRSIPGPAVVHVEELEAVSSPGREETEEPAAASGPGFWTKVERATTAEEVAPADEVPAAQEQMTRRHREVEKPAAPAPEPTVPGRLPRLNAFPRRRLPDDTSQGEIDDHLAESAVETDPVADREEDSAAAPDVAPPAAGPEVETPLPEPDPTGYDEAGESPEPSEVRPPEPRNGHRLRPAPERVAVGSYRDGHHPSETSGLRASLRSIFSRSTEPHEHSFVASTTAGGITRRVCLECGHVSIGVSE